VPRKRRTREHIIADLSANHLERHALRCGFSEERIEHDYGLDLVLFTYDRQGEIENGQVFIQLKASDHLVLPTARDTFPFEVRRADLDFWLGEPMPVILEIYDAPREQAYWLYLQAYFEALGLDPGSRPGRTVTVRVPIGNAVDEAAIRRFARYRDAVLGHLEGVIHHNG
jgi:uncharacterized protein DUF4365